MSHAAAALQAEGLTKTYRLGRAQIDVLKGVTASFPCGSATIIQGASGSGKSTLLHILGGLEEPDAGSVQWNGDALYAWSRNRLAQWRNRTVGFVFQNYQLLPELSALENVELPAMLGRTPGRSRSRDLLAAVGLSGRLDHRPSELSGGEQQRVAIARALRNDPEILLADEPTGNLDAATGADILALLIQLQRERKKTLIVVTHDDTVAARGDFRLRLHDGVLRP